MRTDEILIKLGEKEVYRRLYTRRERFRRSMILDLVFRSRPKRQVGDILTTVNDAIKSVSQDEFNSEVQRIGSKLLQQ